ncbi:MAG: DUF4160 domain-containing protein [Pirellulales bacterium]
MPTVSSFYGIAIRMYYDEHSPPHFHAYVGESEASISIGTLEVMQGSLPRRALAMVLEWASDHRDELRQNWELAVAHRPLRRIPPLA